MKIINRFAMMFKMAWFGFCNPDLLTEQIFKVLAQMLEYAIKTLNSNHPYITHLQMNDKRIVSFWMYPGLEKNPTDRITELLTEIDELKIQIENLYDKNIK